MTRPGIVPRRAAVGAVVRLAVPVVTVQLGMMLMGLVDTLVVGRVSAEALAAVALGHLLFVAACAFPVGTLVGLDPVVAQAVGAADHVAFRRGVQRSLVLAVVMAVPATLLLLPGRALLVALRQPAAVVDTAAGYALICAPGLLPFLVFVVQRQVLQALQRLRPVVAIIALTNLANLALDLVLVYGGHGVPALGALGSAWASTVCRWLMALGLGLAAHRELTPLVRHPEREVLGLAPLGRMLRLGAPVGLHLAAEMAAFGVTGLFMGWLGADAIAAHQIVINLASFTYMVPLGVSAAAAVLVGRAVGAGATGDARRAATAALMVGAGFMGLMAAAFLGVPGLLAGLFTTAPAVLSLATVLLPVAGVFQVSDGLQVVAGGILRGSGDTRTPMLVGVGGFWLVGVPVSLLLAFPLGLGPRGLWWGLAASLTVVAVVLLVRVTVRLAGPVERVLIDAPPAPSGGCEPPVTAG